MNKYPEPQKNIKISTKDFLKLKTEIEFIPDGDSIILIAPSGYKRLNSKWILRLHEKIYPVLVSGCSELQLVNQFPKEVRKAVETYLRILKDVQAFVETDNVENDSQKISRSSNKEISSIFFKQYRDLNFTDEKKHHSVGTVVKGKKTNIVICSPQNLIGFLDKLMKDVFYKQISVLLIPSVLNPEYPLTDMIEWHLASESCLARKFRSIVFYHLDSGSLNYKLQYQKLNTGQLCFRDLIDNLELISPVKTFSQLPLSSVSRVSDGSGISEITVGLNYKSVAESMMIQEIVRQTAFTGIINLLDQNDLLLEQFQTEVETDFISAASKVEIRGNILDKTGYNLFQTSSKARQVDALSIPCRNPAIRHLQEILRLRLPVLPVSRDVFEKVFYLFSEADNHFISISEEKAFYDYLLQKVYSVYHADAETDGKNIKFHSDLLAFDSGKTLQEKIKKAKIIAGKYIEDLWSPIDKISTFWGDYFWAKAVK